MSENKMHYYSEGLNSLHKEIVLFADYIAPTMEELYMRNEIIWRITKVHFLTIQTSFLLVEIRAFKEPP